MRHLHFTAALALVLGAACSRPAPAPQASQGSEAHAANNQELPALTIDQLSAMLEHHEQVAVYDANGRERYEQGHIPSARHVGHDEVTAAVLPPEHNARLVFYCANEH
jgi:rhodanese-related sulfurtransferase